MLLRLLVGMMCCAFFTVQAQDFKKPQEVENRSEPVVVPENQQAEVPSAEVVNPDTVLIESLRGIWIHRSSKDTVNPVEPFTGLRVSAPSKLTNTPVFRDMLNNYMNKPLTNGRLAYLVKEVISYYRLLDYPFVDLYVPEQDITDGVLQLVLRESRVDKLHVQGNQYFSDEYILKVMDLRSGDLPHTPTIYENANWLSENPFLRVQPVFGPGGKDATTDLFLEVEDTLPLRVYSTYSNAGNDLTGKDQISAGVNYGNFLGKGHQVNYQYTTGHFGSGLDAHAVSYKLPLNNMRQYLLLNGSQTRTEATTGGLTLRGESDEVSTRIGYPLETLENGLEQNLEFGFEWKRSKNALEFGFVPVSDTAVQISQAVVGYKGKYSDGLGDNIFGVSVVQNLPNMFDNQDKSDYQAVRAGAETDFTIIRMNYQRQTPLPLNLVLKNSLSLQYTDDRLLSNEQLSVTGQGAVRGYKQGLFNNIDSGLVLRNDLYLPPIDLNGNGQLQPYLFFDYADFYGNDGSLVLPDGSVSSSETISSAGIGLQMQVRNIWQVSAEWGSQLQGYSGIEKSEAFHLNTTLQFY